MRFENYLRCLIVLFLISCEGPEGKIGPAGKNSLTKITEEPAGENCPTGGQKVESGIDEDVNGQLSTDEVAQTVYVCNGKNSLLNLNVEPAGAICPNGGLKIEVGVDLNGNNSLEISEVTQTKFLCNGEHGENGEDGLTNLTIYTNESPGIHCQNGGFKIETGYDSNFNLVLDTQEIIATEYLCAPGTDRQQRLEIGESNVGTNSTDWFNTPFETYRLIKFDKQNYSNIDSITFVPSLYTSSASNKVFVQLYNYTDGIAIADSEVSSNTPDWIFKESKNLLTHLPNKEITIGIRVKSENNLYFVSTGIRSYIFIYKH